MTVLAAVEVRVSDVDVEGARVFAGPRLAGVVGNAVEWYEFAVFGASATLVAAVLTPGGSTGLTTVFAVFGLAFLARPLGAVLGAVWADRAGRRTPLLATVLGMTAATAAIGLLPSWSTAGAATLAALMVLRTVQGLSSGAELVVSVAYVLEHAPPHRTGLMGGIHLATLAAGFAGGMAAVTTVSALLSPAALQAWGWRLPFLVAVPLGLVALRLRRRATETPDFERLGSARRGTADGVPWRLLLRQRARVGQAFLLTAGLMSSFTLWFVYLPARLATTDAVPFNSALASSLAGLVALCVSAVASGRASDSLGRRPVLLTGLAVTASGWVVGYPLVLDGSTTALVTSQLAAGVGLGAMVVQSTLGEAFPLPLRTAGIAVSFGLASALVGGLSPLVGDLLMRLHPSGLLLYALGWLLLASLAVVPLTGLVPSASAQPDGAVATGR